MRMLTGPLSLFTGKVRIALDEKGLPWEDSPSPFTRENGYDPKPTELLAVNPTGQVPVLFDGDIVIYDSTLILNYLEEAYPDKALLPAELADRYRCHRLELEADELMFPHIRTLIYETFYKPNPNERDPAAIAEARAGLTREYRRLDGELTRGPWLCGEQFTIADIGYFMTTTFASSLGSPPEPEFKRVGKWYGRASERPSCKQELTGLLQAMERISNTA